jgi:hypothetical protein
MILRQVHDRPKHTTARLIRLGHRAARPRIDHVPAQDPSPNADAPSVQHRARLHLRARCHSDPQEEGRTGLRHRLQGFGVSNAKAMANAQATGQLAHHASVGAARSADQTGSTVDAKTTRCLPPSAGYRQPSDRPALRHANVVAASLPSFKLKPLPASTGPAPRPRDRASPCDGLSAPAGRPHPRRAPPLLSSGPYVKPGGPQYGAQP